MSLKVVLKAHGDHLICQPKETLDRRTVPPPPPEVTKSREHPLLSSTHASSPLRATFTEQREQQDQLPTEHVQPIPRLLTRRPEVYFSLPIMRCFLKMCVVLAVTPRYQVHRVENAISHNHMHPRPKQPVLWLLWKSREMHTCICGKKAPGDVCFPKKQNVRQLINTFLRSQQEIACQFVTHFNDK